LGKCQLCGKEEFLSYTCSYCGQTFCSEHHLPEKHRCPGLPERKWSARSISKKVNKHPFSNEPISEEYLNYISDPNRKRPHEIAYEREQRKTIFAVIIVLLLITVSIFTLGYLGYLDQVLLELRKYLI
jgi:hypothetical protein